METAMGWRRFWNHPVVLLIFLLGACALHFKGVGTYGFWYDEFCTVESSSGRGLAHFELPRDVLIDPAPDLLSLRGAPPWWRIWTSMDDDVHPPLYFILVRFWRVMVGESDVAIRSLSVAASVLCLPILYLIGRRIIGAGPGMWACVILGMAPTQITACHEARSYAVTCLAAVTAWWLVLEVEHRGARWWRLGLLGVSVAAIPLLHYFAAGVPVGLAVYATVRMRGRMRWRVLGTFVLAGVVYLIAWGPFFMRQLPSLTAPAGLAGSESWGDRLAGLQFLATIPIRQIVPIASRDQRWACMAVALLIVPVFMLRRRPELWSAWLFVLGGMAVPGMETMVHAWPHLLDVRYSIWVAPGVAVLAAGLLMNDKRVWMRYMIPASIVLACAIALPAAYKPTSPTFITSADWRGLAACVGRDIRPDDAIVCAGGAGDKSYAGGLYIGISRYLVVSWPIALIRDSVDPKLIDMLRRRRKVKIVGDLEATIPGMRVKRLWFFNTIGVVREVEFVSPTSGDAGHGEGTDTHFSQAGTNGKR